MKGQACAGTGEEGHLIIFTRAREENEEKKRREKEEKKNGFHKQTEDSGIYILKKLVGLRKMICHHLHAIRQDGEYGAYG